MPIRRSFFARSVHAVAPDLIGATLLFDGVGGMIVEVEAYHHTDPAAHSFGGPIAAQRRHVRPARLCLRLPLLRHPLVPQLRLREAGSASAVLIRALAPTQGLATMRRRRAISDERLLCSGPGRLCQALGITLAHNGLALDQPPFELSARSAKKIEIAIGPRIGISKAADLPWRYGLEGSRFLSKPFSTSAELRDRP